MTDMLGGLGGGVKGGMKGVQAGLAGDVDVRVSQLKAARDYAQKRIGESESPLEEEDKGGVRTGGDSPPATEADVYRMIAEVLDKAL